jgi:hypothetical protein
MASIFRLQRYNPPSPGDRAAWDAEQRWLAAEAEIGRQIMYAALVIAASLIAAAGAVIYELLAVPRLLIIVCLGGMARVIFLIVKRHRTFIAIKTAGGMTKEEAISEELDRYSD